MQGQYIIIWCDDGCRHCETLCVSQLTSDYDLLVGTTLVCPSIISSVK